MKPVSRPRALRTLALGGVVLVVLTVAAMLLLLNTDLGRFAHRFTPLISDALGYTVSFDGEVSVRLGRVVRLRATDLIVESAAGADAPPLLQAGVIAAEVELRALLRRTLHVRRLELARSRIHLAPAAESPAAPTSPPPGGVRVLVDALAARDVDLVVEHPKLSAPARIALATADLHRRDGAVDLAMDATVNGFAFRLNAVAGPVQRDDPAGPTAVTADALLGEITLTARAEFAGRTARVPHSLDLRIEGPDADYLLALLNLPRITSGPLAGSVRLLPAARQAGFTAEGRFGEFHFAADGDLAEAQRGATIDTRLSLAGPNLAVLGAPFAWRGLPAKPFELTGRLEADAGRGRFRDATLRIDGRTLHADGELSVGRRSRGLTLDGRLDDMHGTLTARTEGTRRTTTFTLTASGPNTAALSDAADLAGIPPPPVPPGLAFDVNAQGTLSGRRLALDDAELELGRSQLSLSGTLDLADVRGDTDLRFATGAIDLREWPAAARLTAVLPAPLVGTGRVRLGGGRLLAEDVALESGRTALVGTLGTTLDPPLAEGDFDLRLQPGDPALAPAVARLYTQFPDASLELRSRGRWDASALRVDDATLRLGRERGSITGSLTYLKREVPYLELRLGADRLDVRPAATAGSPTPPADDANAPDDAGAPASDRLIPDTALPFDRLSTLDGRITADIASLYSPATAGARVHLAASLADGSLVLQAFESQGRRGHLRAQGRIVPSAEGHGVELSLTGDSLYVAPPDEAEAVLAARPAYDVSLRLAGRGDTLRSLASDLDGQVRLAAGRGSVRRRAGRLSALVLEDFLAQTLRGVNPRRKASDALELECLVLALHLEDGVASGDPAFAVQTRELNLLARARVDLATERIAVDIAAQPRRGLGISLNSVINPFTRVAGTLAQPQLVVDARGGLLETGAGIATGGVWPLARLLKERFSTRNPCSTALHRIEEDGP